MAEEQKKGVIVEFDFAAMNGAELLYKTAETVLTEGEIPFDVRIEAQYLAGGNCLGGLTEYFEAIITIGAQRTLNRCIEINSLVIKGGATYAVNGTFCDHPEFFTGAIALNQPRVLKLYNFLCEKLGLN